MKQKTKITIDSTVGGNGDVWMRLVSLYIVSAIKPEFEFHIKVPAFFNKLANFTFGDRLTILINQNAACEYNYTCLGLRDLFINIIKGKKYISPYALSVIHDKKKKEIKDVINAVLYRFFDLMGFVQVPATKWIEVYQGYLDIIGIKKIRSITYESYLNQLKIDYPQLILKLNGAIPNSPELEFPLDLNENTVVFPTGTARQFIPIWWAKKNMPDAYYAFFFRDKEAEEFLKNDLKVIYFYKEPGDIIALSKRAKQTVSTDSFPSHLLQYATDNCVITITEVLKSRIISPEFKGQVIDSQVSCHPCLHIVKSLNCAAGYKECLNWSNNDYSNKLIESIL